MLHFEVRIQVIVKVNFFQEKSVLIFQIHVHGKWKVAIYLPFTLFLIVVGDKSVDVVFT